MSVSMVSTHGLDMHCFSSSTSLTTSGASSKHPPGCLNTTLISCYQIRPSSLIIQEACLNLVFKGFKTAASLPPPTIQQHSVHQKSVLQMYFTTYHNREDDGQEGGFEGPEHSQTCDLDQCEQVYPPQRNMTKVGEIGLVLRWHHVQLNPVPEL